MVGFATQNIQYTLWILLAGAALTFVVCVPPWPFYNKDPVKWLPAKRTNGVTGMDITVDGRKVQ
jgi:signal peptidase complex subunit 1